ncbi:unnamed protein product, partial [marine sediment metagenome]
LTIDGSGNLKVYLNGAEIVTDTSASTGALTDFNIGSQAGSDRWWDGKIDEFGIWEKELTPAEILILYKAGNGTAYPFTGQAKSSSIDFNNSTITTATLTSTEVSGSFDYELTADGGSNWESVTSGTAHTFSNTGTDLRWRATENAASTGEISQVTLTSYH